jgi:hypothetical protein
VPAFTDDLTKVANFQYNRSFENQSQEGSLGDDQLQAKQLNVPMLVQGWQAAPS